MKRPPQTLYSRTVDVIKRKGTEVLKERKEAFYSRRTFEGFAFPNKVTRKENVGTESARKKIEQAKLKRERKRFKRLGVKL